MKAQANILGPVHEKITYASREWSGEATNLRSLARVLADCAKKKAWAKLYIPTHVIKVLIAYASSKRPGKPAHSHSLAR